jgi:hypothetical protein
MTEKNSVLNVNVSRFSNYKDTTPQKDISLLAWLNNESLKKKVLNIRTIENNETRKKLKATLPAITVGGTFSIRNKASLLKHSGLMCIDIDAKDNLHIDNYADLKNILSPAPFVAYCGLSVSGTGYFLIIPILYPEKHEQHFEALRRLFENMGINIDASGKDVSRLRGYSYDENPYFNHSAKKFKYFIEKKKTPFKPTLATLTTRNTPEQTKMRVEQCIAEIAAKEIDITKDYNEWLQIAFALSSEFGEEGLEYFIQVSQYYAGFEYEVAEDKYDSCLKNNRRNVGIASFFFLCKKHGISVNSYKVDAIEDFKDIEIHEKEKQ